MCSGCNLQYEGQANIEIRLTCVSKCCVYIRAPPYPSLYGWSLVVTSAT